MARVRQIRVGRQIDSRTRVVLDLPTPRSYSVYALYNPYRVVIDLRTVDPNDDGELASLLDGIVRRAEL